MLLDYSFFTHLCCRRCVRLGARNEADHELYKEAAVGQHDEQLVPEVHFSRRKRPKPAVSTTFWGPRDPQEKTVHGSPARLGPRPGESRHGAQSQFEPCEMALTSDRLQVEADPNREAKEET